MATTPAEPAPRARRAWIALGSNLGDPPRQLEAALQALARLPHTRLHAHSSIHRSPAMLMPGQALQPDYANAVAALDTALSAEALLDALQTIENEAGRVRGERWGARVLDLDLLHIEGEARDTPRLQLPHPGIAQRRFVLQPWAELAPATRIDGLGRVDTLLAALPDEALPPWSAAG